MLKEIHAETEKEKKEKKGIANTFLFKVKISETMTPRVASQVCS